jgi:RNA polymerase sigma factor (sigma-70 family)
MLTDKQLVGNVAQGDQSALASLYDRHSTLLYSVALRITGDVESAEEVLHDTFFQLWQKASQFETTRSSLIGWLLTMIRHRALSRIRQGRSQVGVGSICEETMDSSETGSSQILDQHLAHRLVSSALSELSILQRKAITLAYFDGLTCDEISTQTRTALGTVNTSLCGAFKTINGRLSECVSTPPTLADILITEQLFLRPCRQRESDLERTCFHDLALANSVSPTELIDCFLKMPLDLCGAGTVGLSLLETNAAGKQEFRWTNLTGKLAKHVGGTTPRNFSPCGVTLDRKSPQLFAHPGRYFEYFNQTEFPIVEGLVIPFHMGARTEGTVWIVSHDDESQFDSEDARIMSSLAEFVGCALYVSSVLGVNANNLSEESPTTLPGNVVGSH